MTSFLRQKTHLKRSSLQMTSFVRQKTHLKRSSPQMASLLQQKTHFKRSSLTEGPWPRAGAPRPGAPRPGHQGPGHQGPGHQGQGHQGPGNRGGGRPHERVFFHMCIRTLMLDAYSGNETRFRSGRSRQVCQSCSIPAILVSSRNNLSAAC